MGRLRAQIQGDGCYASVFVYLLNFTLTQFADDVRHVYPRIIVGNLKDTSKRLMKISQLVFQLNHYHIHVILDLFILRG